MKVNSIDIFCEIIDNFGDIGVVYRISKELKKIFQNVRIRMVLNRLEEFKAINKKVKDADFQEIDGLICVTEKYVKENAETFGTADVFIEAFGCNVPEEYIKRAKENSKLWINLEYLSGEKWIEDFHLCESLIDSKTLKKIFYMPGFSEKSGGVIIDSGFLERKEYGKNNREEVLKKYFPNVDIKDKLIGTVFSYEKNFDNLLEVLKDYKRETFLILMGEKTQKSFSEILQKKLRENFGKIIKYGKITMMYADFLSQEEYEEVISAADFNFIRGEDSFVRGILLEKPFMWHIYLQEEKAHMDKIKAFTERFRESVEGLTEKETEILDNYCTLLEDYNDREKNSLEKGKEDFKVFFENFHEISIICEKYSKFLLEKCNLVKKLYKYIQEY
ncbi:elongation factor P maturation arginine rhamnosyltransferase EarP [Fusobacterium perfoetens]|uniref:elongation factor P maturation arginine rhamnosyltransferase EarP n=1 Tax=Fusobacterium perfoetens TaxID=852 RepID=UPI001F480867|nr:elongation factor P maturation arginine rhamnosyltransferase EarP [Fusobacterium perfoetens]MCF2625149.1 elongation factor P maturation arginine rhamnosyltransferase EarP [Fusobacterium perfoetens]